MKHTRIYHAGDITLHASVTLSVEASRHLLKVLRYGLNDTLTIFNGMGGEFQAHLSAIKKSQAIVDVTDYVEVQTESLLRVQLAQGISRGERMDYVIQKSVELGVDKVIPLYTERCSVKISAERLVKKVAHWQAVAISACEQSGRCIVPQVMQPQTLSAWLSTQIGIGFVCDPESTQRIPHNVEQPTSLSLLVGPEGGLTDDEIKLAHNAGLQSLSLGPRVLRTETAAVVSLSLVQHLWGDL